MSPVFWLQQKASCSESFLHQQKNLRDRFLRTGPWQDVAGAQLALPATDQCVSDSPLSRGAQLWVKTRLQPNSPGRRQTADRDSGAPGILHLVQLQTPVPRHPPTQGRQGADCTLVRSKGLEAENELFTSSSSRLPDPKALTTGSPL